MNPTILEWLTGTWATGSDDLVAAAVSIGLAITAVEAVWPMLHNLIGGAASSTPFVYDDVQTEDGDGNWTTHTFADPDTDGQWLNPDDDDYDEDDRIPF